MKAVFRNPDMSRCPKRVEPFSRDPNLTAEQEYGVHSISVYDGVTVFLVMDDLDYPAWLPAWLFRISDCSIPKDWICNSFLDWPEFLIGPRFIANCQDSYTKMVELDAVQVAR